MKKTTKIVLIVVVILIVIGGVVGYQYYLKKQQELENIKKLEEENRLVEEITNKYNNYVVTNKKATLYKLENKDYNEVGTVNKDVLLILENMKIDSNTKYFKVNNLDDDYYISYEDVDKSEEVKKDRRYLSYVPYGKKIKTKNVTNFYLKDEVIYTINKSFTLDTYIVDNDKYYVEYDNQLMYVKKDDIESIENYTNTSKKQATGITTVAYHFIYNPDKGQKCNQEICHTFKQVQSHIDFLKNNHYFTPTMKEFEMWIDGKLKLPENSIMITVDDGWFGGDAAEIFTKNEINATVFAISEYYSLKDIATEYVEVHSHTNNMHNPNACPGYGNQGGGLLCLPKNVLLADLKASHEKLNNTTVIAYPFYDFNDYTIEVLKEAGFTMGFGGTYAGGKYNMTVGANKFKIPRITLIDTTTVSDLKSILSKKY